MTSADLGKVPAPAANQPPSAVQETNARYCSPLLLSLGTVTDLVRGGSQGNRRDLNNSGYYAIA
jgi:hypothetical protein